ncbi:hypothetical protein [Aquimarina sp. AU58]|uniref:hypothetical protein n=1 Tax=Aquimarina sp. AU58 TaxID=1874112 RepID=UPI000D656F86|nr:hypothetical protein [Aquimarina sp. AU58]
MKRKKLLLIGMMLIGLSSYAQSLKCEDFMNGEFYVPIEKDITKSFKIKRNGNSQIEIVEHDGVEKKSYIIIEWIDECSYRLKYDKTKMKFTESEKFINSHNGVFVEKIEIVGNCFLYKSTMIIDGKKERKDGKICKE